MAILPSQPDTWTAVTQYNLNGGSSTGIAQKKLVPKDETGATIDLTGFNSAVMILAAPLPSNPSAVATANLTIVSADATGIVVSATPTQATSIIGYMTSGAPKMSVKVDNGTDNLIAAAGNVAAQFNP